jgi:hypothetical protein
MTDSTSNLDLVRSLEHLAGCLRGALRGAGSANMKITSEDARDVQRAAEVIRLYRMARPAVETNGRITPSADDGVCNHCGLMFSPTSDASKVPYPQPGCSLPKWTRHHYHAGSPEEPKAPPSDVEHLTAALVQQEGVLNECEDLLKEALDENGVDVGFENRLEAYWESSAALADWRTRDLALSSAKETDCRHLTESERASFERAFRNSARVVHEGELAPSEKATALPIEAQCSWGCYYVGDQFIRYAACTVHGASGNGDAPR